MRPSPRLFFLLSLTALSACTFALPDSIHGGSHAAGDAAGDAPPAALTGNHDRDLANCRRDADREMGPESAIDPADDFTANPMVLARREQLRNRYQTLVDQCMGNPRQ